jgi:hypothetical protein
MKSIGRQRLKLFFSRLWLFIGLLCMLFLTCTACVSTQQVADNFGKKWLGRNMDDFIRQYGLPYKQYAFKEGNVVYVWNSGISSFTMPATATTQVYGNTAYTQIRGGGSINMFCEMELTTDQAGVIRRFIITRDTIGLGSTSRCYEVLEPETE